MPKKRNAMESKLDFNIGGMSPNESNVRNSQMGGGVNDPPRPRPNLPKATPGYSPIVAGGTPVVGQYALSPLRFPPQSTYLQSEPLVVQPPQQHQSPPQQQQPPSPQQQQQQLPQQQHTQQVYQYHREYSPPKARMRVSKACDRCRTQKIKCSGTHPCTTCLKHKKECTFSTNYNSTSNSHSTVVPAESGGSGSHVQGFVMETGNGPVKRLKKVSTVEPFGLPQMNKSNEAEYITHLENRVQYLENILSNNSHQTFQEPKSEEPENPEVDETLFSTSSKWRFSRRHQNLLIVELCKSMYSNLSPESQKLVTLPRTQYFGWNMSGVKYLSAEELPPVPEITIDSKFYIDYYLTEINPLFAIIHETVFREQYEAYNKLVKEQLDEDDQQTKTNQTRLFSAILCLIYALSIRFSEVSKPKGPKMELLELEEKFFKYGYKVISILSFEWESFELIQSWLLIGLYLRITHRQTSCSHALSQAIAMVKSMGLGFEDENPKFLVSTAYERLKAKRIFWCVFTFDRVLGLQTGRYCGIREEDFTRRYPTYDFKKESDKDDWLTLPALGMIHVARVSNFVHTSPNDNPHLIKYQQINAELVTLHEWFNNNGFRNDLFFNRLDEGVKSLVKAQVKLHYYDLVLCIHGKVLFNYIGRRIASHGLKVEMVLDSCHGVLDVLDKINKAGLLYTPWYSVLLLLFNIGVSSITLINGGVFVSQARDILKSTIRFFTALRKSPIRNEQGKLIFRERFKMVRECMWALKMANRMLTLRLQEDIKALNNIGVDHGSSDVNKQTFTQLGLSSEAAETSTPAVKDEFNKVFEKQLYRNEEAITPDQREEEPRATPQEDGDTPLSTTTSDNISNSTHAGGLASIQSADPADFYATTDVDNLLGNLQWFDQWLGYDF
ncbi:STB4 [[Candida] subhashii]|uniref:STB4 n=1 Tax=[Candida] subhashii TaxID=561895 RepID=A0A8J5UJA2_9ASCO|nr:STB4 [[Candida] subhashii]KAG7664368.1 STB4 [[Candida] subhashii]